MTKAKDTAPAPGRRVTENPNMEYPTRQGKAKARTEACNQTENTPAGSPEELHRAPPGSEEPEKNPLKGDNWTGTQ